MKTKGRHIENLLPVRSLVICFVWGWCPENHVTVSSLTLHSLTTPTKFCRHAFTQAEVNTAFTKNPT